MTIVVGDRTVKGKIMRREEAQATYDAARSRGQVAALLNQQRPNVFTQAVANILPGQQINVTISYVETLQYDDGSYEWSFPMVVAPRYLPAADPTARQAAEGETAPPEGLAEAGRDVAEKALTSVIDHWRRHGFGRWAAEDKETRQFVGFGGLRSLFGMPEVVYHFAPAYWGKGLATELGQASLRYGFEEHRFEKIVAIAKPENAASIRVMEKLGMHYEMNTSYYDIDVVQYTLAREEYKPNAAAAYVLGTHP